MVVKLDRDCFWFDPNVTRRAMPTPAPMNTLPVNLGPATARNHGYMGSGSAGMAVTGDNGSAIGVAMQIPVSEPVPFRFQAMVDGNYKKLLGFGFVPSSETGSEVTVDNGYFFNTAGLMNTIIMIRPLAAGDPNEGGRLIFFAGVGETDGGGGTATRLNCHVAVQNLWYGCDPFSTALF
jgi:hypothetical protein